MIDRYAVPQIRRERLTIIWYVTTSENGYIYRFNEKRVLMEITTKIHTSINQSKDNSLMIYGEKKIVERDSNQKSTKRLWLPFSTWSLRVL